MKIRSNLKIKIFILFLTVCVFASLVYKQSTLKADNGEVVIDLDFIAAALQDQEAQFENPFVVNYVYSSTSGRKPLIVKYIKTPTIQYLEQTDGVISQKCSYDSLKKEYKELSASKLHSKLAGLITNSLVGPLGSNLVMDPIRYNFAGGNLLDNIKKGLLSSNKVLVDGVYCWKITIPSKREDIIDFVVLLDPLIGFCPRVIEENYNTHEKAYVKFEDYKELKSGVWFPMKIAKHFYINAQEITGVKGFTALDMEYNVSSISYDKVISSSQYEIAFPSGTEVLDEIDNTTYTVK